MHHPRADATNIRISENLFPRALRDVYYTGGMGGLHFYTAGGGTGINRGRDNGILNGGRIDTAAKCPAVGVNRSTSWRCQRGCIEGVGGSCLYLHVYTGCIGNRFARINIHW